MQEHGGKLAVRRGEEEEARHEQDERRDPAHEQAVRDRTEDPGEVAPSVAEAGGHELRPRNGDHYERQEEQ